MIHICRTILIAALIVTPSTPLLAAGSDVAPPHPLTYQGQPIANTAPANSEIASQRGYGYRHHRNDAALTSIVLGAAGVIAGTAMLVYANRPECSVNANFSGCGYGSKVVGSSLLAGGLVGVLVGTVTWR